MQNDKNKPDEPTAFERIQKIGQRVSAMKSDGFDGGHEALIRFLDELREYMGWPASDDPADRQWRLKPINESRSSRGTKYDRNFPYVKTGRGFDHACTLEVTHPGTATRASFEFKAKSNGENPVLWAIAMNGKEIAKVDSSDYEPPQDALEKTAKKIGASLYHEAWNG